MKFIDRDGNEIGVGDVLIPAVDGPLREWQMIEGLYFMHVMEVQKDRLITRNSSPTPGQLVGDRDVKQCVRVELEEELL